MTVDRHPPAGPPGPWDEGPDGYGAAATSGLAIASLVCSLVGLATLGLTAVPGVICGHMALGETRSGRRGGRGMAIAGLVVGWVQCALWVLFWVIVLTPAGGAWH